MDLRWARVELARVGHPQPPPAIATAGGTDPSTHLPDERPVEVPLRHGEDVLGTLFCGPKVEGRFAPADHQLLRTVAGQVALAAHNIRLSAELSTHVETVDRQAGELRASRARIVHAQDTERRRIERDLHDGIQHDVIALIIRLRLARNHLARDPARIDATLAQLQQDAYHVIDELRELAHGIHPPELTDQGLAAAVTSRARRAPIPITLTVDQTARTTRFASDIEEAAFFIVSEALTNVLKHSHAEHATILIAVVQDTLLVQVVDNGIGLPANALPASGLTGLRDRAEAAGGTFEVTGNRDGGITVQARFPTRGAIRA